MNSLSAGEKRRLVSAMNRLIEEGKYVDIASIYGGEYRICPEEQNGCGSYDHTSSLPWNRLFMVQMEDELGEALPYWDWTEDKDVPDLWEEIRAPLKPPLKSECGADGYGNGYGSKGYGSEGDDGYGDGGGGGYGEGSGYKSFVARKTNININVRKLKKVVRYALESDNFADFSERISIPHHKVHKMVGCDMGTNKKAAYDPVFYLHNTFIDYLWAYWQELQRWRGKTEGNKGRDYKCNLCYEYEDLIFDGETPAQFYYAERGCYYGCEKYYAKPSNNDKGCGNGNDKGYGKGRGKGKGYGYGKVNRYGHNE